jgi:hypothetical protein
MLDPVNQIITSQFVVLDKIKTDIKPIKIRYIWPSEMDLMAHVVGMKLIYHWDDWNQSRFTGNNKNIAIYGLT